MHVMDSTTGTNLLGTFSTIYECLSLGLKENIQNDKVAVSEMKVLKIKCEYQGEKRVMQLPWPAQYKDLMSKIKSYYNIDLKLYYASSQQKSIEIQSQTDLDAAATDVNCNGTTSCLHIRLFHTNGKRVVERATGKQSNTAIEHLNQLASRESPPPGTVLPGTMPRSDQISSQNLPCVSQSDGMFIPDDEDMISIASSSSRSSLESYSSTRSAPGSAPTVEYSPVTLRSHSATYPKRLSDVSGARNLHQDGTPSHTFPKHDRRQAMSSPSSCSSLTSTSTGGSCNFKSFPAQKSPHAPVKWRKGRLLGSGAFGQVLMCYDEETGREMALKLIEVVSKDEEELKSLQYELQLLKNVTHDRLVQYYGSRRDGNTLMIFMEYVSSGSVLDQIKSYGALTENVIRRYCKQILEGLEYLHQLMILHRDIKGSNILRDHAGNVKLSDFGVFKRIQKIASSPNSSMHSVDSPHYLAPEVVDGKGNNFGRKSDVWSFGCTVIEMTTGHPPWHELNGAEVVSRITCQRTVFAAIPNELSNPARDFIASCLQQKINERWSASQLLQHSFVVQEDSRKLDFA